MEITESINFISEYGLFTIISAAAICGVMFVADIFFKDRIPAIVKIYAPFVVGMLISVVSGIIKLKNDFIFNGEYISSGLLIGSLSNVFYSLVCHIKEDKSLTFCGGLQDKYFLLAENTVKEFVLPQKIDSTAKKVSELLEEYLCLKDSDDTLLKDNVVNEILKNKKNGVTDSDVKKAVSILIQYAKAL